MSKPKLPKFKGLALAMIGEAGQPDIPLGNVDLTVLDRDDERVWLAGILKDASGQRIAQVNMPGIRIADLPQPDKGGRPPEIARRMSLCLAWCINFEIKGRQKTAADMETMRQFGRQAVGKVADIRRAFMKRVDHHILSRAPDRVGLFIESPTIYRRGSEYEVLGLGWCWHRRMGKIAAHGCLRITGVQVEGEALPFSPGPFLLVQY
jgi:hypothetical protein